MSYEQFIRQNIPGKEEIDDFLNNSSWAKFDPELSIYSVIICLTME